MKNWNAAASVIALTASLVATTGARAQAAYSADQAAPQEAAGAPPAPAPGARQPGTPSDAPDTNGIGDIIVTASRRAESLQRTAIPVTAITSDTLTTRGVQDVTDISRVVPAVKIGQLAGSAIQVTIRGIGNFGGNTFAEPGVAFNLDGVYVARGAGAAGVFYDVDRVEVLKGPQGTLYGRNSTGGVVNLITRDPKNEFGFNFVGEYGNPDRLRLEGGVNIPVADWLAVRVAGQRTKSDGFTPDGGGSENNYAGRVKVRITPTPALSILLEADYAKNKDGQLLGGFRVPGYNPFKDLSSGPNSLQNSVIPSAPAGAPFPPGLQVLPLIENDDFNNNSSRGLQGTVNYDFGPVTTTLIVANRWNKQDYLHYGAGFPVTEDTRGKPAEYSTAELRVASSNASRFKWVVGGFFFDDHNRSRLTFDQGVTFQVPNIVIDTKSYSGFAEGTYSLTPTFRLTAGGRYTSDRKRISGVSTGPNGAPFAPLGGFPSPAIAASACPTAVAGVSYDPAPGFGPLTGNPYFGGTCTTPIDGRKTFDKFTYKVGAEFDVGPRSLLYGTVSTGFKSGGFYISQDTTNVTTIPANQRQGNSYRPETLMAYTLGSKNRLLDNHLQLNLEAFYWRYKNKQYTHLGIVQPANAPNLIVDNAGAARVYGAELEAVWQPTRSDTFSADAQYLHAKYNNFVYNALFQGPAPVTTCPVGPITPGMFNSAIVDCSGRPVSFSPRWTLNLSYNHVFDLGGRGRIIAGASTQVTSHFYAGEEYLPDEYQKGISVSNAELTWQDASSRFGITGFVKNIEQSKVLVSSFVYPFTGSVRQSLAFPRTYGARVTVNF